MEAAVCHTAPTKYCSIYFEVRWSTSGSRPSIHTKPVTFWLVKHQELQAAYRQKEAHLPPTGPSLLSQGWLFSRAGSRMGGSVHDTAALGFSLQTQHYESVRPSYENDVVEYAVAQTLLGSGEGKTILDLGAGTGKLTRATRWRTPCETEPAVSRHLHLPRVPTHAHLHLYRQLMAHLPHARVIAAEPVVAMREEFCRALGPHVEVLDAAASALPFQDNSLDAVFVGQAFHWFCDEGSLREMHRVLRPGGFLCLLWNMEDEADPLMAALRALYERYDGGIPQYRRGAWSEVFRGSWAATAFERPDSIPWSCSPSNEGSIPASDVASRVLVSRYLWNRSTWLSAEQVWQRVLSKSYIAVLAPEQQTLLKDEIMSVLKQHSAAFKQLAPSIVTDASRKNNLDAIGTLFEQGVVCMPIRTEVALTRKLVHVAK